jgi:cell division protein FtsW (lipid II flippase)
MDALQRTLIIIGLIATTAMGDYYSKMWSLSPGFPAFVRVLVSYSLGVGFWLILLRDTGNLARAGLIWGLSATAVLLVISQVAFQECLTLRQWIGIGFGTISMVLLM